MVHSKPPKTGNTIIIPKHVKHAKNIFMMKLGSLGAYTCVDNAQPCLSIAHPPHPPHMQRSQMLVLLKMKKTMPLC
jgi:hypothetical protein